ncbi:hypothetical protein WME95_34280 [Sorangium sp. So ce327]|uniref:hypothetical protein n=1 Tax=Sorangium sp. So ce327 TaxID=3133301 RepID=UPI003F5F88D2
MTTPSEPSKDRPKGEPWPWATVACIVFGIALLSSLATGFVLSDRTAVVAIAAPTLLLAMAFARIDLFQEIKGAGVELKLRQAEEVTREAKATISELRLAASTMARISLELLGREGVLGKIPDAEKVTIKNDLVGTLRTIGVSDREIETSTRGFNALLLLRHAGKVVEEAFATQLEATKSMEARAQLVQALNPLMDPESLTVAPPERYRAAIEKFGVMGPRVEERLADYEFFITNSRIRRPAHWD